MGRRRREQEASQSKQTLSSLFAAVPKPPLCAPPIGLNHSETQMIFRLYNRAETSHNLQMSKMVKSSEPYERIQIHF
jgi:hypothetical protein